MNAHIPRNRTVFGLTKQPMALTSRVKRKVVFEGQVYEAIKFTYTKFINTIKHLKFPAVHSHHTTVKQNTTEVFKRQLTLTYAR